MKRFIIASSISLAVLAGVWILARQRAGLEPQSPPDQPGMAGRDAAQPATEASSGIVPGLPPSPSSQATPPQREIQPSTPTVSTSAGNNPPAGFIRKTDARWLGTDAPQNTFQSALWALHHGNLDALLQLLEPGSAARLKEQIGDSPEKFFREASRIPAMRISDLRNFGAATMKGNLDLGPDDRVPRNIFFFLLDGQWKIVLENPDARFTP
jgi:hypothetical protein